LHIDRSDPVVAVALTSHVGSARERRPYRICICLNITFLGIGKFRKGGLDKIVLVLAGWCQWFCRDRTNYFRPFPKDALEKMIWAEADKVGYFINTVLGF
jgi:zinc protease